MDDKKNGMSIKIEDVKTNAPNDSAKNAHWASIFKVINPLGHIQEAYANTLKYKIECKRLDAEIKRVEEQSKLFHKVIDNNFKLKVMELENRRAELVLTYQTVNNELDKLHIERIKVMEMAELATRKTLESGLSIEDRTLFKELAIELTSQIPAFGDSSNESLKHLIKALPPVNLPLLLTEGAE